MAVEVRDFGTSKEGRKVSLYSIKNSKGMQADVMNVGAILVNLFVPGADGKPVDLVLGFDTVDAYYGNPSFFGSTIGPSANRIGEACYELDGVCYELDMNDNENNLHSHFELGYHKRYWDAETGENSVTFSLEDPGTLGFPGTKSVSVTYTVTEENELRLHYHANSTEPTIINLTNHTYFNLDGHDSGSIVDHKIQLFASKYTPCIPGSIPTGAFADVAGTVMDLTKAIRIGEHIDDADEQLLMAKGYDHNFCVDGYDGSASLRPVAQVTAARSGRVMKVFSDLPGVQFYAGNCIVDQDGKNGVKYGKRCGFCLETQYYPDTIHHENFPSCIFGGEEADSRIYDTETVYQFV